METLNLMVLLALVCPSLACRGSETLLRSGGLSCREKEEIVDLHNKLRQAVALGHVGGIPAGMNMLQMSWDDTLAEQAQQWANQCLFQHNSNSERRDGRFTAGQNLAVVWSQPRPTSLGDVPDFSTQIVNWFNEVYKYRYGDSFSPATGHFTQLVWSDSYLIGCGYSYYKKGNRYSKLYVCHYGPGGNVRGFTPYDKGNQACTLPSTSPSKTYAGLCEVQGIFTSPCYYR